MDFGKRKGYVTQMGEKRKRCNVFISNPEGKNYMYM
jgi:hypothetical protein